MSTAPTPLQIRAYQCIAERLRTIGVAPSLTELGRAIGSCRASARCAVNALAAVGWIRKLPRKARAIELVRVEYYRFDDAAKELVPWP